MKTTLCLRLFFSPPINKVRETALSQPHTRTKEFLKFWGQCFLLFVWHFMFCRAFASSHLNNILPSIIEVTHTHVSPQLFHSKSCSSEMENNWREHDSKIVRNPINEKNLGDTNGTLVTSFISPVLFCHEEIYESHMLQMLYSLIIP